jgi:hypothetical protein
MKRKIFTTTALLFCFVLCFALAADLNGKWSGQIKLPDGSDLPVDDGKVDGDNFSFKVTVDGAVYPHTGKVYADSCALDIDFGGLKVHTKLKHTN